MPDKQGMKTLKHLFENNKRWAESVSTSDPDFFKRLAKQQTPRYLWIGCSDSRVPANQITGLEPGEVFVHRNVANLVIHTDLNCLSVIQYAVDYLNVTDIIVCGHYGCGGVLAALSDQEFGISDSWLRFIKDTYQIHKTEMDKIEDKVARANRLCELNVKQQVLNVCHTSVVQSAWKKSKPLSVHGWIYGLDNGRLKDLETTISSQSELQTVRTHFWD